VEMGLPQRPAVRRFDGTLLRMILTLMILIASVSLLTGTAASLNAIPSQLKSRITSGKYHQAVVGACPATRKSSFTAYNIAVLLYP